MQLSLQLSKLQGTTSYFDENVGRVKVKSDTVFGQQGMNHSIWNCNGLLGSQNITYVLSH